MPERCVIFSIADVPQAHHQHALLAQPCIETGQITWNVAATQLSSPHGDKETLVVVCNWHHTDSFSPGVPPHWQHAACGPG